MRKSICWILMFMFISIILNASQLTKITPVFSTDSITFMLQLDTQLKQDDFVLEKNASGSIVSIYLKGVTSTTFYLPIAYGPVESMRVFEIREGTLILVHLLIPVEPTVQLAGNTLRITIPSSGKKVDLVLTADSTFETAVKFLADELGINVVLSDSVKDQKVSLKLLQVSPEDALRNLLTIIRIQNEPLAYSYMPDGTLHIGTKTDIAFRFGKFWGIYDVTDREVVVEKLQSLLTPPMVTTYLPNKAILFVYGDVQEQELISKVISLSPVTVIEEVVLAVPADNVIRMLESLKRIYAFEYTLIEGLDKVVLQADPKVVDKVKSYIREYQDKYKAQLTGEQDSDQHKEQPPQAAVDRRTWSVIYPEQAQAILKELGIESKELLFSQIEVQGTTDQLAIAEKVLDELGFFSVEQLSLRTVSVPNYLSQVVLETVKDIFGLKEPRMFTVEEKEQLKIVVFAPPDYAETIVRFVNRLLELLSRAQRMEIFFLEDEGTAKQVGEILSTIYGMETISVQNVLKVVGSDQQIDKARNFINFFVREKIVRIVDARFDEELFAEIKQIIESKYKVSLQANLRTLGKVLISSYNLEDIENAAREIGEIYQSISKLNVKSVKLVAAIAGLDFGVVRELLEQLESIKILQTPNAYILAGSPTAVEKAEELIEQLRDVSVEHRSYFIFSLDDRINKDDLSTILQQIAGVSVFSVDRILIVYGDEESLKNAESLINEISQAAIRIGEALKVVQTVKVVPYDGLTPIEELQDYLRTLGKNVEIKLFRAFEIVSFVGPGDEVEEAIKEYVEVSRKLAEKQELERQRQELERQEKLAAQEKVKVTVLEDGNFSVKCDDAQLYEVISKIASMLGKSIIYFDKPLENITLDVKSIDWSNLIALIEEQYGYRFAENEGIIALMKSEPVVDTTAEQKFVYTVPHNLENIKPVIEFYGGKVLVDPVKNLLIVTGIDKSKKEQIEALLIDISKPLPQVEIEARFVDRSVVDDLTRKYGLKFGVTDNGFNLNVDSSGEMSLTTSVIGLMDYQRLLSLLLTGSITLSGEVSDKASLNNLLASPRIVTSSGQQARILIGERIKYYYTDPQGNLVGPETMDTGIELRITPFVRSDGTIDLKIFTKVSEPKYYPGVDVPGEITREAETSVVLREGDTLVIGGLMRDRKVEDVSKVPVLGDLPFIGTFFRSKTESYTKQELVIFITAKVIGL